jgi:hypothetical protein
VAAPAARALRVRRADLDHRPWPCVTREAVASRLQVVRNPRWAFFHRALIEVGPRGRLPLGTGELLRASVEPVALPARRASTPVREREPHELRVGNVALHALSVLRVGRQRRVQAEARREPPALVAAVARAIEDLLARDPVRDARRCAGVRAHRTVHRHRAGVRGRSTLRFRRDGEVGRARPEYVRLGRDRPSARRHVGDWNRWRCLRSDQASPDGENGEGHDQHSGADREDARDEAGSPHPTRSTRTAHFL